MNQKNKSTRREMLKTALVSVPAGLALLASSRVLVAATSATPNPSAGASGLKWVPETDPTAKALKYVSDATKANRTDRSGVKGKDQNCAGCSLYTKQGTIDGKEAGKCLMIQGGSVTAIGWCGSWAKKA